MGGWLVCDVCVCVMCGGVWCVVVVVVVVVVDRERCDGTGWVEDQALIGGGRDCVGVCFR